jgi:hypothetical protein
LLLLCTGDPQLLAPLIRAVPRPKVLTLLPRLLVLPPEQLRPLYRRLTTPAFAATALPEELPMGDSEQQEHLAVQQGHFTPVDLLLKVLALDADGEVLTLQRQLQALEVALRAPETFPQPIVQQVGLVWVRRVPQLQGRLYAAGQVVPICNWTGHGGGNGRAC